MTTDETIRQMPKSLPKELPQRDEIPFRPQADNLINTDRRQDQLASKFLAGVDIADMYFDGLDLDRLNSISEGVAVMPQRSRIDDQSGRIRRFFVKEVDDGSFVIRLERDQFVSGRTGGLGQTIDELRQRRRAVDLRFPFSQEIQIWPIHQKNSRHGSLRF